MQFRKRALGLFEEEEAEEGHNQTSHTEHLEEGTVGGSNDLRCGSAPPPIHMGSKLKMVRYVTANVAVGAHQTSHLAGDATLHQRHQSKGGAFTGLHKEEASIVINTPQQCRWNR